MIKIKYLLLLLLAIVVTESCDDKLTDSDDSNNVTKLTNHPSTEGNIYYATISPNGEKIIFAFEGFETTDLYSIDIDGNNEKKIIPNVGIVDHKPIISISNKLAFISYYNTSSGPDVYLNVSNLDGSNKINLLNSNESLFVSDFSPDGEKILYILYTTKIIPNTHGDTIWLIDRDGKNNNLLYGETNGVPMCFSPDGNRVLFGDSQDGDGNILTCNTDGSDVQKLSQENQFLSPICYSPDGTKILCIGRTFDNDEQKLNRDIFLMNTDGSELKRIISSERQDFPVSFSPNGKQILFYANSKLEYNYGFEDDIEMYLMNTDGSNLIQLTNNSNYDKPLQFTPDGNGILFISNRDGNFSLYLLKL